MKISKTTNTGIHKILITIFTFVFIPFVLFVLITSRTSLFFGMRSFDVMTGSMEPKIHVGSMIFTIPQSKYHIGEVITFKRGTVDITHQIVAESNGQYKTQGVANTVSDMQLVSPKDIIGRNFLIIPFLGRVVVFIKTVPGFLLLIALPTIIYIALEVMEMKSEWEKEVENKIMRKLGGLNTL